MAPRKVYDPSVEESPPKNTKPRAYGSGRTHVGAGGGSKSGRVEQPSPSTIPDCDVETPVRKFVKQGADSSAETGPKGGATNDEDTRADTSKKSDRGKKSGEESDEDEESDSSDSSDSSEEDSSDENSSDEDSGEEGSSEDDPGEGGSSECEPQVVKPKNKASSKGRRSGNSSRRPTKKEELRMLEHLLKKYPTTSKSDKGNRSSKAPRPSKPSKLKPKITNVKPKEAVAESKTKSKKLKAESGTEGETTDVSRIESASGSIELGKYTRLVLTRMGGWQNLQEIDAQPLDNNGRPTCWVDNLGSRQLRLNWDNTIDAEWKVWKQDFMAEFRRGKGFTGDVDDLRRFPEDAVKKN